MLSIRATKNIDYAGINPLYPSADIFAALDIGFFGGWQDSVALSIFHSEKLLAIVAATPLSDGSFFVWILPDRIVQKRKKSLVKALLYIRQNAINSGAKYDIVVEAANRKNMRFAYALGFQPVAYDNKVARLRLWTQ